MAVSPIGAMMSAATAAPVTGTQQLGAAGIPTDTEPVSPIVTLCALIGIVISQRSK